MGRATVHSERTRGNRRSSVGRDTTSVVSSPEVSPGRWPEARIIRQVNTEHRRTDLLRKLLDDVGQRNYGVGTARAAGSIACTYVDSQSLGRMFDAKFDKFSERKVAKKIVRDFASDYNGFVRQQEKSRIDAGNERQDVINAWITADPFNREDYELLGDLDYDFLSNYPEVDDLHKMRWNMSSFAVRSTFEPFGNSHIGLDFEPDEQMHREWEETVGFLKDNKLDVSRLQVNQPGSRHPRFHLTVFDTLGPSDRINLNWTQPIPGRIELLEPSAKTANF